MLVQRWILAKLRHCTFVGLAELNAEIRRLLIALNQKPFQKLEGCRGSTYLKLDKPALRALPKIAYEYKQYQRARAGIDYHVCLDDHFYSVPHQYCGELIELWFNQDTVVCYLRGKKIAKHLYSSLKGKCTTIEQHMPTAHRKQSQQSAERFIHWAGDIGPYTQAIIRKILDSKSHPEQAYRACLGLLNLTKQYSEKRLEKACCYAWDRGVYSRKSIASILKNNLEKLTSTLEFVNESDLSSVQHDNIRGARYYH